jgi:hypothetical protein
MHILKAARQPGQSLFKPLLESSLPTLTSMMSLFRTRQRQAKKYNPNVSCSECLGLAYLFESGPREVVKENLFWVPVARSWLDSGPGICMFLNF